MSEEPLSDGTGLAGRLTPDGHELRQRVYFEDTDFSGRVYHARYLHFLERGRSDLMRLLGIHHGELARDGSSFVVRRITVDYLKGARIDDVLTIRTAFGRASGARIALDQSIVRGGQPIAKATVEVVMVDARGVPKRLPAALRTRDAGADTGCMPTPRGA